MAGSRCLAEDGEGDDKEDVWCEVGRQKEHAGTDGKVGFE